MSKRWEQEIRKYPTLISFFSYYNSLISSVMDLTTENYDQNTIFYDYYTIVCDLHPTNTSK